MGLNPDSTLVPVLKRSSRDFTEVRAGGRSPSRTQIRQRETKGSQASGGSGKPLAGGSKET